MRDNSYGMCRQRWFNPPFSKSVSTNVGAVFLRLVTKHFPKTSRLHTIFNRNSVKVSYCCLPNMASLISSHNRKQMTKPVEQKPCNCRSPPSCPLRGDCRAEAIVYEAVVTTQHDTRGYFGSTAPPFKLRLANHKTSMRLATYRNSTELSKHVWGLKSTNEACEIKWRICERSRAYSNLTKRCPLCTAEKTWIALSNRDYALNKRSEMVSKCRHASRYCLKDYAGAAIT